MVVLPLLFPLPSYPSMCGQGTPIPALQGVREQIVYLLVSLVHFNEDVLY